MYLARPVRFVFADDGFAGKLVDRASRILATTLHIVLKPEGRPGFAVIPRRWAVERTFAWLARGRPATRAGAGPTADNPRLKHVLRPLELRRAA